MNLRDWIELDFAVIDATETIQFTQHGVTRAVDGVKSQALRREAIEKLSPHGAIESTYRSFSVPVANLSDRSPLPGDLIQDSRQVTWRVVQAKLNTADTRWVVVGMMTH